jgi:hypothetical protein
MRWQVSNEGLIKCLAHVTSSVAHFETTKSPFYRGYNHNTTVGCMVGVKCEVALSELVRFSIPSVVSIDENFWAFRGKRGHGDIDVVMPNDKVHVLEVKGLQEQHWARYQRCVTPKSIDGYVKRNSIVVWGTTSSENNDTNVELRGWNWAWEIKEHGKYIRTICDNIQLSKDFPIYSMLSLVQHIRDDDDDE